jgi:hypothetical protein
MTTAPVRTEPVRTTSPLRAATSWRLVVGCAVMSAAFVVIQPWSDAYAFDNPGPVTLGASGAFTVLAGATVTNTGSTVISADAGIGGNLGVSPGSAVTGFPPGVVVPPGAIHAGDAMAGTAQTAARAAYNNAKGRTPDIVFTPVHDLVGQTFTAGVYNDPSSLALSGNVTLDGEGNPDAVFIFQSGSTLGTSSSSQVLLTNGAQACNVFWAVGSSATLGADSAFSGTILAKTSATVGDSANVEGRVLAGSGGVTLANDAIHTPACAPTSGVGTAPLFGSAARGVALTAFLVGACLLIVRRRRAIYARPRSIETNR